MWNQDKKVEFILVDEYGAPERSYEIMRICHNINITVKNTGGDEYSLNGKIESPNKILANITRYLLLNSGHKKEPCCFAYQYDIWIYRRTENRLRGNVTYFLWHGKIFS